MRVISCVACIDILHRRCKEQMIVFTELNHNYRHRIANLTSGAHKIALCINKKLHVISSIVLC